jgi:hypothetical protein
MTIRALIESDSRVSRLIVWSLCMALDARNLRVQTGERISRLRVIKLADADYLPVFEVVALLAALSEPPGVRVPMAGCAGARQTEISPVQILDLDGAAFLRINS